MGKNSQGIKHFLSKRAQANIKANELLGLALGNTYRLTQSY